MIFFFIHRFNDIDHLTPVIYRINKDTDYNIKVWCLNPFYDITADYRLTYLRNKKNIEIDYLYKGLYPSLLHRILSFFLCKKTGKKFSSAFAILSQKIKLINKLIFHLIYGEKWVKKLFTKFKPDVIVLDGTAASSLVYNMQSINDIAKKESIPKISLPHGVPLFVKHPKSYDNAKKGLLKNDCNKVILPSKRWMNECIEFGVPKHKLDVIGVARHCEEWEKILQDIVPWDNFLDNIGQNRLKVVYMDMGPDRYEEFKPIVEKTLKKIQSLDFIHLLFKPHTRSNKANLTLPENVKNVQSINSHNLIKWADVVIGMSSSIVLGVLMQGKTYISPKFFRKKKMVHEEHGACWTVNSIKELEEALIKLKSNPSYKPYNSENIENFLTEIVYAGEKNKDVLGAYEGLILSYLSKNKNRIN